MGDENFGPVGDHCTSSIINSTNVDRMMSSENTDNAMNRLKFGRLDGNGVLDIDLSKRRRVCTLTQLGRRLTDDR